MSIENIMKNWQADPWNATTDVVTSLHVQTAYYSGSYDDRTVPSTANYPDATPTRYFLYLPFQVDVSDLAGAKPISVYDNNSSATLTKVTAAPGANEYRVVVAASNANNIIEFHSTQAGHSVGIDCYSQGGIVSAAIYDYLRGNYQPTKSITADYSVTDTDGFNYFYCSSSDARSTITLPSLANNIDRVLEFFNSAEGVTRILRAGSDTINDGVNDATEVNLYSRGDKLKLIGTSTEWVVQEQRTVIDSGWINRSDWTSVHIGSVTINIDGGSSGSLGYEIGEGVTSSSAGGRIIDITDNANGTGVLIVFSATGGGSFINNAAITGNNSSASAVVNGATKNVDSYFFHNNSITPNTVDDYVYINSTNASSGSYKVSGFQDPRSPNERGYQLSQIDNNNLKFQTGNSGIFFIADTGGGTIIDTEDWYYKLVIRRLL